MCRRGQNVKGRSRGVNVIDVQKTWIISRSFPSILFGVANTLKLPSALTQVATIHFFRLTSPLFPSCAQGFLSVNITLPERKQTHTFPLRSACLLSQVPHLPASTNVACVNTLRECLALCRSICQNTIALLRCFETQLRLCLRCSNQGRDTV